MVNLGIMKTASLLKRKGHAMQVYLSRVTCMSHVLFLPDDLVVLLCLMCLISLLIIEFEGRLSMLKINGVLSNSISSNYDEKMG
jgi:hypothetical protein